MKRVKVRFKRLIGAAGVVVVAAGFAAGASSAATSTVAVCATFGEGSGVQSALVGTGYYSAVDVLNCDGATPTVAELQNYDAVFAFPDFYYSDFNQLSQNLATYVDGGGRVVLGQWGFASCCGTWWGTALDTGDYLPYTGSNVKDFTGSLDLVMEDPSSPLLASVTSVHVDTDVAVVSLRAGATSVAHWSNDQPAVAFKGNVVALNLWPYSGYVSGDWVQLLANALSASLTTAQGNRAGFCSVLGNTTPNGTAIPIGTFLDLAVSQPSTDSSYKGVTPAYYYQDTGISCDLLPGYTRTGEMVGYGGHGDPGGYTYMAKN